MALGISKYRATLTAPRTLENLLTCSLVTVGALPRERSYRSHVTTNDASGHATEAAKDTKAVLPMMRKKHSLKG
jgi:hypothetical protein